MAYIMPLRAHIEHARARTHTHTHKAENDVVTKKISALEAEVAAVREEKRRVERQLSLTVANSIDS
jgi:hypothetical protein